MAAGLPILVLLGVPIILFRSMTSQIPSPFWRLLGRLYGATVAAYVVWLLHLFLNMPPLIKPVEFEVFLIWLAGLLGAGMVAVKQTLDRRKAILNDPLKRQCPHCKKMVEKLAAICSGCGKGL